MIKLLRKVRKKLLTNNKVGSYLLYAIGEIALVMIGILLAIQVNNWNENRKVKQQEQTILQSLSTEFETNKQALQSAIDRANTRKGNLKEAFNYTGRDVTNLSKAKSDTIIVWFASYISAEIQNGILNDLLSTGNIHILQNRELKELLNGWQVAYADEVGEVERRMFDETDRTYNPFLVKHYKAIYERVKERHGISSGFEEDYKTIYSLQKFEILCAQKMNFYAGAIRGYEDMIEYCDRILNIIDKELKN